LHVHVVSRARLIALGGEIVLRGGFGLGFALVRLRYYLLRLFGKPPLRLLSASFAGLGVIRAVRIFVQGVLRLGVEIAPVLVVMAATLYRGRITLPVLARIPPRLLVRLIPRLVPTRR